MGLLYYLPTEPTLCTSLADCNSGIVQELQFGVIGTTELQNTITSDSTGTIVS